MTNHAKKTNVNYPIKVRKKILDEFFDGRLRNIRKLEAKYKIARNKISTWVKDEYRKGRKLENIESKTEPPKIYAKKDKEAILVAYLNHPNITIQDFAKQNNIEITTFSKWLYAYRGEHGIKKKYSKQEKLTYINLYKQTNGQITVQKFSEQYGIARTTFSSWLQQDRDGGLEQKTIHQILNENRKEFTANRLTSKNDLEYANRKQQVPENQNDTSRPPTSQVTQLVSENSQRSRNSSVSTPSEILPLSVNAEEWPKDMLSMEEIMSMYEPTTTNEGQPTSSVSTPSEILPLSVNAEEWPKDMLSMEEIMSMYEPTTTNEGQPTSSVSTPSEILPLSVNAEEWPKDMLSMEEITRIYEPATTTNEGQATSSRIPFADHSIDKEGAPKVLNNVINKNEQVLVKRKAIPILPKMQSNNPLVVVNINGPIVFFNMNSKTEGSETISSLKDNLFETLAKCFSNSNKEAEIYSNNTNVLENKEKSCEKKVDPVNSLQAAQSEFSMNISHAKEKASDMEMQQKQNSTPKTTNTKLYKSSKYRLK